MLGLALSLLMTAAPPAPLTSGELSLAFDRLGVLGSVLYVAAHPDDENTRLFAWLLRAAHLRADYLSLTRGEGGQNLVGVEQDELLGLIRTQELLAARRIDGAEQHFTRARDFGYSKTAEESLRIWGKEAILADVVWAIRTLRPDIIITRFTPIPPNHGHHMASAVLAADAFEAAADPARFPEQLAFAEPWRATRLVNNVSTWRMTPDMDLSKYLKLDVGAFEPRLGLTVGEIAARSRSMHKSQGFGVAPERGPILEYFSPLAGEPATTSPFEGLDLSWSRIEGGGPVGEQIAAVSAAFDARQPERSIPSLVTIRQAIAALSDPFWRDRKLAELDALLLGCAGIAADARAPVGSVLPGGSVPVTVSVTARQGGPVTLKSVRFPDGGTEQPAAALSRNAPTTVVRTVVVATDAPVSTALPARANGAIYPFTTQEEVGRPEGAPPLSVSVVLDVGGAEVTTVVPVVVASVDPLDGERARPVEVVPPMTVTFDRGAIMVPRGQSGAVGPVDVPVRVETEVGGVTGSVSLDLPAGWTAVPTSKTVALTAPMASEIVHFSVTGPRTADAPVPLSAVATVAGVTSRWSRTAISHPHIPPLTIREPAQVRLVPVSLATGGKHLGYIPGPGDKVADCLASVGYDVRTLPVDTLESADLRGLDAIVVGVRAFNQSPALQRALPRLLEWVKGGGRLIVQYMTNNRLAPLTGAIGPYPLTIGQGRVTDENAALVAIDSKADILSHPNVLGPADYAGWVQERGLYFAETWDPAYTPVFSTADPGEPAQEGALLVATYGKGVAIYTGIGFFRQLPAGVPGAYRLLANLLAVRPSKAAAAKALHAK